MYKTIDVKITNKGKDGDTLCFKLEDKQGRVYAIGDCYLKETQGLFKGYFGSYNGIPAHLNIFDDGRVELLLNQEQ